MYRWEPVCRRCSPRPTPDPAHHLGGDQGGFGAELGKLRIHVTIGVGLSESSPPPPFEIPPLPATSPPWGETVTSLFC